MTTLNEAEVTPQRAITVGTLALQLLTADRGGLEIEIPADTQLDTSIALGASVKGGVLRFASLEDRNAAAAADALARLGDPPFDEQALWTMARDLWRREIGNADMASGRFLAAVHSSASVLRIATSRITSPRDVFEALHLVEATLPYLETVDLIDVITLCDAERPHTTNDLAGGAFYHALSSWFGSKPASARHMVEMLLDEPHHTRGDLLGAAWMAWFSADQHASVTRLLEADTQSGLAAVHAVTCWIAGRMLAEPSLLADLAPALEAPILRRINGEDAVQRRAGLRAASAVLHLRRAFDEGLRGRITSGDQEAAGYVAQALWHNDDALLQAGIFFEWLQLCVGLGEGSERAIDDLDFSLSRLLRPDSAHVESVLEFLEAWVRAHLGSTKGKCEFADRFDACTRAMLSHQLLLSRVFTRWMLADGQATANAAAGMVSNARVDGDIAIEFDPAVLDTATEADLLYLVKRMLGFLIEAKQMLSLSLSLLKLRNANARVFPLLRWLLYEQLGYDHPRTTSDVLRKRAGQETDADIKELLGGIAARLEADMAALQALPRLRELEVPMTLRRDFAKARSKVMQRSMREAQKQSVIAQLATQIHIKAGETSFQHMGEAWSEPMHFASHSVSFEMPRREVLDPLGNAYRRLQLRTTKRGST
ncbi:hypothetical protein [Sphaerotilus microaerophilus]|uniref:Uncharacterized protein n=1 Tax=Sphaerotilus microaerophilus TaxID=2914710 RepID=A0ABN6PJ88_9BURK|nr:hypothetical protein [Sphaerotilus sp. FB-5]BDI05114.1 hypothetical protein CATMQ487_20840 [Sphaerotilus sp. FB-5]